MDYPLWSWFLPFLLFGPCFSQIKCNPKDNCACYRDGSDLEIQCPVDDSDLIIHVTEKFTKLMIDCTDTQEKLHTFQLPNITTKHVKTIQIRFCPWPQESFREVIEKFSPENVASLEFECSKSNDVFVTANYFQNLQYLQSLSLNENGLTDLAEDTFRNTPNLIVLDLSDNNIILKKNLFQNLPLLEFLDLSKNDLKQLPFGVFKPLKMLQKLHLVGNKLKNLDSLTFTGLINLRSLELTMNQIENIAEDTFKNLGKLTQVNLSNNKIKKISSNLFIYNRNLKRVRMKNNFSLEPPDYLFANSSLTHLVLTNCYLKNIPEHIFENSTNLKIIDLGHNNVESVPQILFKGLANLKQILLKNNKIKTLSNVFEGLSNLRLLDLQSNKITSLDGEIFSSLAALEKLNLNSNNIEYLDPKIFHNKTKLKVVNLSFNEIVTPVDEIISLADTKSSIKLDLSHNKISSIRLRLLRPLVNITIKLDYNQINSVDVQNVVFNTTAISRIFLNGNPIDCCQNYDLVEFVKSGRKRRSSVQILGDNLRCFNPPELKEQAIIKVPPNLTCSLENLPQDFYCPEECSCEWKPSSKSLVVDCSYRNLKQFPKVVFGQKDHPFNNIEVNLEGNYLNDVPELDSYYYVTKLFLSQNKIREILDLPPKLEVLELHHNLISTLHPYILSKLNSTFLVKLTLHDNPWICDCNSEKLADFLRQSNNPLVRNDLICLNKHQRLRDLKKADLCDNWKTTYLPLMVLSVLLAFTACAACYYRYQHQIKIWLFSRDLCLWWVTEEDLDKDKTYDAFISYSHKDEEFVVKNLLPTLEASPQAYNLCLHYRNWTPGELITNQITNSVLKSKRTLVVLSKNFLESVWGKMEFRVAHTQAMSEGRVRVIIVLYGDIEVDSLDEELKMYLKTNTYVKWGDPYFWHKLKYALPHKKVPERTRGHSLVNMVRVHDEAILITSAPSSPGTTPPISLNSSMTEMAPFRFGCKVEG